MTDKESIKNVITAHQDELLAMQGVIGLSSGKNDRGDIIQIQVIDQSVADQLPDSLDGYPVVPMVMDRPEIY